jgi:ADP-ribose pyrophosphatase
MKDFENLTEIKTGSEEIFDGIILHVFKDTVELPNGKPATREVIRHVGAVGVIPITDDGKVLIERQFRYPLNRVITEIPAGKLDSFTEDRLSAAKRELEEETGYTAAEWINMGDYYPAAAYCDERITLYLAKGLSLGQRHLDEDEFLNFAFIPLAQLVEDVMAGRITDGKTQVAVLKAARLLEK